MTAPEPSAHADETLAEKREHPARATLRRLMHHRLFVLGLVLCGIIVVVAVLAPWITTVDPYRLSMRNKFRPPGRTSSSAPTISAAACGLGWCGARNCRCSSAGPWC